MYVSLGFLSLEVSSACLQTCAWFVSAHWSWKSNMAAISWWCTHPKYYIGPWISIWLLGLVHNSSGNLRWVNNKITNVSMFLRCGPPERLCALQHCVSACLDACLQCRSPIFPSKARLCFLHVKTNSSHFWFHFTLHDCFALRVTLYLTVGSGILLGYMPEIPQWYSTLPNART